MSVNKVILIGNMGKDPESKDLTNGKVTNFSLATSESYKNKQGEKVTNTDWHNVLAYSPLADIIEKYTKKGSKLYIEGKLTTRSWDDKEGNKRYVTEVIARNITMLDSKTGDLTPERDKNEATAGNTDWINKGNDGIDDLPF